ncbi:MAG: hypothetical protein ACJ8AK_17435 [Gemmatimonadaceae bacterium]
MAAEHHDNGALALSSGCDGFDNLKEIARDENVGERFQERGEAAVLAGRGGELSGSDLVRPALNGNRPDLGKICFLGLSARVAGLALTA